jgi:flagellar biosynthesis protein FliR
MIAELAIFRLFLVVLARFAGLMVSAPVLGSANIPMMGKVGFTALTALIITPQIGPLATPVPPEPLALAVFALGDFAIGLMLGFVMSLTFAAIQVAGQIMDMQSGFGMMNVFNPALEVQFPIFGFFLFIVAVLYLLVINGHHLMIRALIATYDHIPPGGFVVRPALFFEVTRWGSAMFIDGVMIAAPISAAMLLAYATMGLLGRVVPQIHLFVVGFPVTIATGLILVGLILHLYIHILNGMFFRMFHHAGDLMRMMG